MAHRLIEAIRLGAKEPRVMFTQGTWLVPMMKIEDLNLNEKVWETCTWAACTLGLAYIGLKGVPTKDVNLDTVIRTLGEAFPELGVVEKTVQSTLHKVHAFGEDALGEKIIQATDVGAFHGPDGTFVERFRTLEEVIDYIAKELGEDS